MRLAAACIAILTAAAAVRIYGALGDLWLDEILALNLAGQVASPLDIFTKIHSEVNHHLYTAYLYFIGPQVNGLGCRIPSLLAGIGAVVVSGLIGRRRGTADAIFAMLLTGFSYVLILYSSEARGYAEAVFFAFLSFHLLDRYLETKRWPAALMFSLSTVLGFLSQLTFLCFYLAALVWSVYRLMKSHPGPRQITIALLACHAAPILFLAAFYFVDVRHIEGIGGTPSPSLIHSYGTALAWAMGAPSTEAAQFLACVVAVAVFWAGIRLLWREKSDSYVFFPGVILVFPILLVVVRGSDAIYVRYFTIGIAFLLLLGSFVLADLWRRGLRGKTICSLLLVAYLAANGWHTVTLFQYGRGQYREAIRFMAEHSNRSPITIGSDHDFRVATVLRFYGPAVLGDEKAEYCQQGSWPRQGPEWVVCHKESFEAATPPVAQLKDGTGNEYEFVKTFPTAPLSGLHWFLYHNRPR